MFELKNVLQREINALTCAFIIQIGILKVFEMNQNLQQIKKERCLQILIGIQFDA
jgi:hypothetical protein